MSPLMKTGGPGGPGGPSLPEMCNIFRCNYSDPFKAHTLRYAIRLVTTGFYTDY